MNQRTNDIKHPIISVVTLFSNRACIILNILPLSLVLHFLQMVPQNLNIFGKWCLLNFFMEVWQLAPISEVERVVPVHALVHLGNGELRLEAVVGKWHRVRVVGVLSIVLEKNKKEASIHLKLQKF